MLLRKSKSLALAAAAAALFCGASAHANLVSNGGFETGDFTGWTTSFTPDPGTYKSVDVIAPQAGDYAAYFGSTDASDTATIGQTLATVAGATYDVSFWLMNEADVFGSAGPNFFEFDWGGVAVTMLTDAPEQGYTKYSFVLAAASSSTDLTFQFRQEPAFWDFDSVDVVASAVPEPGSFALAALALTLALTMSGRRPRTRHHGASASI